jgi:hypothetical protein
MGLRFCYFCGDKATSKEHVPPKSFFPEESKCRLNLITVPSCDKHNNEKSETDEYILQFFAGASKLPSENRDVLLNYVYQKAAKSMIMGSTKKNLSTVYDVLRKNHPEPQTVFQISSTNGYISTYSVSVKVNQERVLSFLESVARGILNKELGIIWKGSFQAWPHFLIGNRVVVKFFRTLK